MNLGGENKQTNTPEKTPQSGETTKRTMWTSGKIKCRSDIQDSVNGKKKVKQAGKSRLKEGHHSDFPGRTFCFMNPRHRLSRQQVRKKSDCGKQLSDTTPVHVFQKPGKGHLQPGLLSPRPHTNCLFCLTNSEITVRRHG